MLGGGIVVVVGFVSVVITVIIGARLSPFFESVEGARCTELADVPLTDEIAD